VRGRARWLTLLALSLALALNLAAMGALRTALAQDITLSGDYDSGPVSGTPPEDPAPTLATGDLDVGINFAGSVSVEAGGFLWTEGTAVLGVLAGSQGDATVTGDGSMWNVLGELTVGDDGTGTLTIEDGGQVRASYESPSNDNDAFSIGSLSGSQGDVMVTGDGSTLEIEGPFKVGDAGHGTLTIEDGGTAESADTYLGYQDGSQGDVTVTSLGSQWSTGKLVVGASGSGTLTIGNQGWVVTNGDAVLGSGASSTGTATVSGSGVGLGWSIEGAPPDTTSGIGNFTIGESGTGILTIEDGGSVDSIIGASTVGGNSGSQGTVLVTGQSSIWKTAELHVGYSGTGTVTVADGGSFDTGTAILGYNAGSRGDVTVTGDEARWNSDSDIYVGYSGTGTLTIEDNGAVVSQVGIIGYNRGSTGTVTVTGNGAATGGPTSTWLVDNLTVGSSGNGNLTIENGGEVTTNETSSVGLEKNSTGTVTVTGAGSTWYQLGGLSVGVAGEGTLSVEDGGQVLTDGGDSVIGTDDGAAGTVTVTGEGSKWDTSDHVVNVGFNGQGTLNVEDGGSVSARTVVVGGSGELDGSTGRGDVTVTGEGSLLETTTLYLGNGGQGTLTVDDGGVVESADVLIGFVVGGSGTINLNGADGARGVLETAGIATIGGRGQINFNGGTLRASVNGSLMQGSSEAPLGVSILAGGAFVDSNGHDVSIDLGLSGQGGLTKLGDGTLTLSGGNSYSGATQVEQGTLLWGGGANSGGFVQRGQYVINGGTLDLGSGHGVDPFDPSVFGLTMSSLSGSGGTVQLNLADLIVDQAVDTTYAGIIVGAGGLTKKGDGSLTLTGDSTYTGGTVVDDGALVVNGSIAGDVTVNGNGTVSGTGIVDADLVNGGTVGPGNSIGTLTVTGDYTQNANGVLELEADFAQARIDRLIVGGDAALAGRIRIDAASILPDVKLRFLSVEGTLDHSLSAQSSVFDYTITQAGNELSLSATGAHFGEPGFSLNEDQDSVASHLQEVWGAGGGGFGTLFATLGDLADSNPGGYASALSDISSGASGAAAAGSIATTQQHLDLLLSCPMFAAGSSLLVETECVWSQAGAQALDQKASGGVSGFDTTTYSLQAGVQRELTPDWFVGFAGGYDRSTIRSDDDRVSADGDILYAGASLKHQTGPWLLSGAVAGSYGWYDNTRTISIPGFSGQAEGDPDVYNLSARFRAAYTVAQGDYYMRPLVDFDLIYTHANGYRESGAGLLDLAVEDNGEWSFHATPALEVGTRVALGETTVMRAFAAAGVSFSSADSWETSARLANAPAGVGAFDTEVPLADVVGRLTAGVDIANDNGFSLRVNYQGSFSDTYTSHGGALRLGYKF
jgi:T5SS/PEP-CTERM-associated repeat protein/autotransporter-associated beta strand protein